MEEKLQQQLIRVRRRQFIQLEGKYQQMFYYSMLIEIIKSVLVLGRCRICIHKSHDQ